MLGWDLALDYIIFGVGSGATLIIIGWVFRTLGPIVRDRPPQDEGILSAIDMVYRMAWARFCGACGVALALSGCIVVVAALVASLLAVSDERGGMVVLVAFAAAVVLSLGWLALFLKQFGTVGIVRKSQREQIPVPEEEESGATAPETASEITSEEPNADEIVGPQLEAEDESSFAETVSSRGGIGRFSAFLRKGDSEPDLEPDETYDPTAGVIDALEGVDDAKTLSVDDPLVTSVVSDLDAGESLIARLAEPSQAPVDAPVEIGGAAVDRLRQQRLDRLRKRA